MYFRVWIFFGSGVFWVSDFWFKEAQPMYTLQIYSLLFVACLFIFLVVPFEEQELLILQKSNYFFIVIISFSV
jgi:hypothetical protein